MAGNQYFGKAGAGKQSQGNEATRVKRFLMAGWSLDPLSRFAHFLIFRPCFILYLLSVGPYLCLPLSVHVDLSGSLHIGLSVSLLVCIYVGICMYVYLISRFICFSPLSIS